MILLEHLQDQNILAITPQGPLEQSDFETIAKALDPIVVSRGSLTGLMINMQSFRGWRNVAAFVAHMKFVAGHHRKIDRIAAMTNSSFLKIIPGIAGHILHPEIRSFGSSQKEQALSWLATGR